MNETQNIEIEITLNGQKFPLSLPKTLSIMQLKSNLSLDQATTRMIAKGKTMIDESILMDYFDGRGKILVLSSSKVQIEALENLSQKWIINRRNYSNALVSKPSHEQIKAGYARKIETLGEFTDHVNARDILIRIRDDYGIKTIMEKREWRIGTLMELHPIRDASILGYNQNKGWQIALRLRTDALDGFISFDSIIKVMLHELAHMVHSGHGPEFHALDRELNAEYTNLTHDHSMDNSRVSVAVEYQTSGEQRLGGRMESGSMREVLARAASGRLSKEEEEMEKTCGA